MHNLPADKNLRLQRLKSEAHVWFTRPDDITDPGILAEYMAMLSREEQDRHRRFHFEKDRHSFLVSHALVRRVLSSYTDVEPAAWQFAFNQHGRPEIASPGVKSALRFNLTHTAGLVACVVTLGTDCGIDAEKIAVRGDPLAIAGKMFAASEQQALKQLEGDTRLDRFFTYWTLRESYCKALGVGLAHASSEYAFVIGQDDLARIRFGAQSNDHRPQWQFSVLRPTPGHIVAVALRTEALGKKIVVCECIVS